MSKLFTGAERIRKDKFYPLYSNREVYTDSSVSHWQWMAKWNGEKRVPKKGEWFLSGAVIEAYLAFNDLAMEHYIAKLVRVRKVEYWEEIKEE